MGGQATDRRARYQAWQYAAKLLLDGADAEQLTRQIEYALTLDGYRRFDKAGLLAQWPHARSPDWRQPARAYFAPPDAGPGPPMDNGISLAKKKIDKMQIRVSGDLIHSHFASRSAQRLLHHQG
jgi:hypothetical protein